MNEEKKPENNTESEWPSEIVEKGIEFFDSLLETCEAAGRPACVSASGCLISYLWLAIINGSSFPDILHDVGIFHKIVIALVEHRKKELKSHEGTS